MTGDLVPLRVTAQLEAGVATGPHGIALDGLLASVLHSRTGPSPVPLIDVDEPDPIDLPLARCGAGLDWHWAATNARAADGHGIPPDVRYWVSHLDDRDIEVLSPHGSLPKVLSHARGRYRSQYQPLLTTVCSALTWTAVGDVAAVADLLQEIPAIGKRRAHGHGRVTSWTVTVDPELDPWSAGHVDEQGELARPTPPRCLPGRRAGDCESVGIRPPYRHPTTRQVAHTPSGFL